MKKSISFRQFLPLTSLLALLALGSFGGHSLLCAQELFSEVWQSDWQNPGPQDRPLQIVHGGISFEQAESRLTFLKEKCGLGGIVCNCRGQDYLEGEEGWKAFLKTVETAKKLGLRVWIYDEDGYPSPAAGGLVLKGHPEFEAQELAYDAANPENPFVVRDCFEFTHATNNFCAVRRYPNVLNGAAMERFLDVTHRQYAKRLQEAGLWDVVEAFFTDEPSTNAFNTGVIPNLTVRTQDEPNPEKKNLPVVVWNEDLPEVYAKLYGEDLLAVRKSLFTGETEQDRKVRRQFWSMVSQLYSERFMGKIQKWCAETGKLSSGHALHEESLLFHVPCYGNVFAGTNTMQLAGMDYLSNQPGGAMLGWRTATCPASSNIMNGQRRMMTEISDHNEWFSFKRRATLEEMELTAAWQMVLGCTEFTLYYGVEPRGPEAHKSYCEYVGRINSVIRNAEVVKRALLYYPARELQEEYLPVAERLSMDRQTDRMHRVIESYYARGQFLMERQIPFFAADDGMLRQAEIVREGEKAFLALGNQKRIEAVVIPSCVNLPETTKKLFADFRAAGGTVIDQDSLHLLEQLPKVISGETKRIVLGEFQRDGYAIFLLTNSLTEETFQGELSVNPAAKECRILNPATGEISTETVRDGKVSVKLNAMESRIFVIR